MVIELVDMLFVQRIKWMNSNSDYHFDIIIDDQTIWIMPEESLI